MGQGKSILKNTLIYAVGNFGSKALTFLLLPLYSFYLTKDEFGTYDLIIVSINLLAPIITLQTSEAIYRWLLEAKEDTARQARIIFHGFVIITGIAAAFFVIYYILTFFISFQYTGYFAFMLLISCYLPFLQKILRGLGKTKVFAASGILYTLTFLGCTVLFLSVLDMGLESLLLASVISGMITITYVVFNLSWKGVFSNHHFNSSEMKEMVMYSLPLVPNAVSWWLINAADKYLIVLLLNIQANGIYAVSTRFPAVVTLVNSIFLLAWQDHGISVKDDKENTAFFSKLFDKFITLELTLVIFLISISYYLVRFLIDPVYLEAWKYLPFLFIGVAFQAFASYVGVGYQRAKRTKHIFTTSLAGGIVNILISLLLLKHIGLYAPAVGTFFSFLVMYVLRKIQTDHFFKIEVNNVKLVALTSVAIIFAFLTQLTNLYLDLFLIGSSFFGLIFLNKKLLHDLFTLSRKQLSKTKNNNG
ncbi:lipopolysaccharide biosynthesis protein [Altibacter lentus]|uniref:lipopolysaccharide biosynthesis protein n=1 Tax=Altibacter lentus TaxID=1223410 RepID=UPI00054F63D8|nr:oligosaccharide flippase family protein [Altibacter lentus]